MSDSNVTSLPLPKRGEALRRRKAAQRARLYRRRQRDAARDAKRDGKAVSTATVCDLAARVRLGMDVTPSERDLIDRLLMRLVRTVARDGNIYLED